MKIDAETMAKEFYEARNPTMKWASLVWWEKLHMAVLAEREACLDLVNQGTGEATSADALKILHMERDRISAAIRARGKA